MLHQEIRKKISNLVISGNKNGMLELERELVLEKMSQNKFFSDFLGGVHHYAMEQENTETPLWKKYKTKLKEYDSLVSLISTCSYYTGNKNVQ